MSDDPENNGPEADGEKPYEIGYKRTPVASRYKKGQSGNPRGRPRLAQFAPTPGGLDEGKQRADQIFMEEAYRQAPTEEKLSMLQLIYRTTVRDAVKGNAKARDLVDRKVESIEEKNRKRRLEVAEHAIEYKAQWAIGIDEAKAAGRRAPDPFPHPDDIIVDLTTGSVSYVGPVSAEERALMMRHKEIRDTMAEECEEFAKHYVAASDEEKECILPDWEHTAGLFDRLNDSMPPRLAITLKHRPSST